jgi:hypothetical protein
MKLVWAMRIRKVLVPEVPRIARIARRNSTSHFLLEALEALGVSIYWRAQRIDTLLPAPKDTFGHMSFAPVRNADISLFGWV